MKHIFLAVVFVGGLVALAWAGRIRLSNLGPTSTTSRVTLAAAGSGVQNCITDLDVVSDAAYTLRILDGSTTAYVVTPSSGAHVVRAWDDGFCGTTNTILEVTVNAGNYNINYMGFKGQ